MIRRDHSHVKAKQATADDGDGSDEIDVANLIHDGDSMLSFDRVYRERRDKAVSVEQ